MEEGMGRYFKLVSGESNLLDLGIVDQDVSKMKSFESYRESEKESVSLLEWRRRDEPFARAKR